MARPQSPELRRSGTTPALEPDNIGSRLEARRQPGSSGETGPVPEGNQPGHRPERDQDKPDPDAFVARFNGEEREQAEGSGGGGTGPADGAADVIPLYGTNRRGGRSVTALPVRLAGSAARLGARTLAMPTRMLAGLVRGAADRVRPPQR
jgi:hypothetical protein